jgi:hypothetical protein
MLPTVAIDARRALTGFCMRRCAEPRRRLMSPIDIKEATDARTEKVDIKTGRRRPLRRRDRFRGADRFGARALGRRPRFYDPA